MIEVFSLAFGGITRLAQHWMDLKDKNAERVHELSMGQVQIALADKKHTSDEALRRMDVEQSEYQADTDALRSAIESQTREAQAAGGRVAQFSALIRPFLTVWHVVVIYTAVKVALVVGAMSLGTPIFVAVPMVYGPEDRALCFSMAAFWFVDRGLRRRFGA